MSKIVKKLVQLFYAPLLLFYLKKDRYSSIEGIRLKVNKGVFHPGFFYSTKFLINAIKKVELANKKVLELGAGSGMISFYCASKGAQVTATDISPIAINGLVENNKKLQANVIIIESDLFDKIPNQVFDFIIINPPYYPKNPNNDVEKAWYCGENFEYFEKLFFQIGTFFNENSAVLISFSEDCQIDKIALIAQKNNLKFELFKTKKIGWECNFIYKIIHNEY